MKKRLIAAIAAHKYNLSFIRFYYSQQRFLPIKKAVSNGFIYPQATKMAAVRMLNLSKSRSGSIKLPA